MSIKVSGTELEAMFSSPLLPCMVTMFKHVPSGTGDHGHHSRSCTLGQQKHNQRVHQVFLGLLH